MGFSRERGHSVRSRRFGQRSQCAGGGGGSRTEGEDRRFVAQSGEKERHHGPEFKTGYRVYAEAYPGVRLSGRPGARGGGRLTLE
jgi:hypothetical protein